MKGTKKTRVTKKSLEQEDENNDLFFISTTPAEEIKAVISGKEFGRKFTVVFFMAL
jgi:hypothetical protein